MLLKHFFQPINVIISTEVIFSVKRRSCFSETLPWILVIIMSHTANVIRSPLKITQLSKGVSNMRCLTCLNQTRISFYPWRGSFRQRTEQWEWTKMTSQGGSEGSRLVLIPCEAERSLIAVFWGVNSILLCERELSTLT